MKKISSAAAAARSTAALQPLNCTNTPVSAVAKAYISAARCAVSVYGCASPSCEHSICRYLADKTTFVSPPRFIAPERTRDHLTVSSKSVGLGGQAGVERLGHQPGRGLDAPDAREERLQRPVAPERDRAVDRRPAGQREGGLRMVLAPSCRARDRDFGEQDPERACPCVREICVVAVDELGSEHHREQCGVALGEAHV